MSDAAPIQPDETLDARGMANICSDLTPLINRRIRQLSSHQVLEVLTDDPAAREAVPAWSRLSGNSLVQVLEDDPQRTRFYLRRA